jgi:hypothetical protein
MLTGEIENIKYQLTVAHEGNTCKKEIKRLNKALEKAKRGK